LIYGGTSICRPVNGEPGIAKRDGPAPDSVEWLCSAAAVRERCARLYAAALAGDTPHFRVDEKRIDTCVDLVAEITLENYPDLDVPYHSRWRHFCVAGVDHWAGLRDAHPDLEGAELARVGIDLAFVSVLLDAGAGGHWRYRSTKTATAVARSEGLALASFDMFENGAFSSQPRAPLQADAKALQGLSETTLAAGFQSTPDNPLLGVAGRCEILRRLGDALPAVFPEAAGANPRIGYLFDVLQARSDDGRLAASAILDEILRCFVSIWPNAQRCGDTLVGDVGKHTSLREGDVTHGLVPFHKLSQWLAYSLVEPLEWAGIEVYALDALTGLAEYRNGGLLIDTGVLRARDTQLYATALPVYSEPVVEWRALTVALLDEIARGMRARLRLSEHELPLAKVLQGGTWTAGRRVAGERRRDAAPPIRLVSDGTVF